MGVTYDSLLETAEGAIMERVDEEAKKVWLNLKDPNTDHKAKRTITLKLTFQAVDEGRQMITMHADVSSRLAPMVPVPVSLWRSVNEQGEPCFEEVMKETPGQLNIDGSEAPEPKIVQLSKERAQGE